MVALLGVGVPWNEAWDMSPARAMAILVVHGEQRGGKIYNWDSGKFEGGG